MPIRSILRDPLPTGAPIRSDPLALQERERRRQARPADDGTARPFAAPLRALIQNTGSDIADGDWDVLFHAVQDRLTHIVSDSSFGATVSSEAGAAQLRDGVLECVAALALLQDAVAGQRAQRDELATAAFEAQTSLAQVRAGLVGTQQEERRARYDALHDKT